MITITDATRLAGTKLRTRKIRTGFTILLASLLFGVLIAASLVLTGAFRSVESFREDGLTGRYIVAVDGLPPEGGSTQKITRNPELITEAKKRYEELVKKKTAEAERLGAQYSSVTDQPPYSMAADGKSEMLAFRDPNGIVDSILAEKFKGVEKIDYEKLQSTAKQYGAIRQFESEIYSPSGATLTGLPGGEEVFYDQLDQAESNAKYERPLIESYGMELIPPEITEPYLLPNNGGWQPDGKSLPIILPQDAVERALQLEKLPSNATPIEKLERLKVVRSGAAGLTIQMCYRNTASSNLIQQTIQQQKEIAARQGDKEYQKPSVIYSLPDPAKCENPSIASDTRSADEKKQSESQKLFEKEFNADADPVSYFVGFTVVGVSPPAPSNNGTQGDDSQMRNLSDVVSGLLKTDGVGQAIPRELYDKLPDKTKYADLFKFTPAYFFGETDNKQSYVEFSNNADAERFINEQACEMTYDQTCEPSGRSFMASYAFSSSAAVDDIRDKAQELFYYVAIGVIVLAAITMWITTSRTISDSRRETAVFRAIGFKRIDITMAYILYTILLSLLVAGFATIIGWAGAYVADKSFAPSLTAQAQYAFGGLDMTKEVSLLGVDQRQLVIILAACIATGILSAIIPLVRNVRRSPIRDMRDE